MPNLISDCDIPRGYFWTSDNSVDYKILALPSIALPEDTILYFGIKDGSHYYKLTNLYNYKLSLLKLVAENLCNEDFFRVSKISSRVKRKGYAFTLYLSAIQNSDFSIISDTSLTIPGSYNIWRKLFRVQNPLAFYRLTFVNLKGPKEQELQTKTARTQIWGFDEGLLEIIKSDFENLEFSYNEGEISKELFEYLRDYFDILTDKKHIRLIARK